ncbi:hypothetical protein VNI00_003377 [Paramarasmius palmivorus]|uniref:FHF complex subunit HOOK-interacting protein C-terminal domain-containing protein n=1 Tax=Paramarasmius palmivorus TaxID=297713 RepID=A0AAW0DTC9_9AGAR
MDYFSKFLRSGTQQAPKAAPDYAQEFIRSWSSVKNTLLYPDERQLSKGIKSTDVPGHLESMVDSLVSESTRIEQGTTGACLEYLLKNDVLGTLVRLSETDRPYGIQAEVLRAVQNMVVLLDEQTCAGDDMQEQLDGRRRRVMGAAGNSARSQPSEFEEDLVNLLCILCSRIRTYRELLMIFFHDKHWYRSEPLFAVEEQDEDEDEDEDEETRGADSSQDSTRTSSPTPSHITITTTAQASSVTKKPEYEFLLFNYLLRFVHREGQIGEFARAGLLLLMDVAMSPGEPIHRLTGEETQSETADDPITEAALALAEYILDGDFSEVLGAGLGAVYSLLPSKIEFRPPENTEGSGMVIGSLWLENEDEKEMLEVSRSKALAMGVEDAGNPDFKSRLDHFLRLLEFLQDVLRRNIVQDNVDASSLVGTAIVSTVLECSDADGSAVAVMSYVEIMIRTLRDGQLAELLIDFLVSEDNDEVRPRPRPQSTMSLSGDSKPPQTQATDKKSRRKSSAMALLEMEAPEAKKQSEYFTSTRFTPAVTSALQLLQTMLLQYPELCVDRIILVISDPNATAFPHPSLLNPGIFDVNGSTRSAGKAEEDEDEETFVYPGADEDTETPETSFYYEPEIAFSTHEREMDLYLTLVSRVDPSHNSDPFSTGYEHYLRDALYAIQDQSAYRSAHSYNAEERRNLKHRLNVNDPIISCVLESLRRFFSNTPECNIALTGALSTLAIHPDRSLAGWLTFASNDSLPNNPDTEVEIGGDGDDRSIDYRIAEKLATHTSLPASSLDENSRPVLHTIFHGLVAQLERYRQQVPNFDQFFLERRQGLLFSENLTDALSLAIELTEEPAKILSTPVSQEQAKPKSKASAASTLVSFLTPRKNKTKPSISQPPSTPPKRDATGLSASPFAPHYQKTGSINVEPFVAPAPSSGPWTPAKRPKWSADEEDVFSSGWTEQTRRIHDEEDEPSDQDPKTNTITLSHLLDNVVILGRESERRIPDALAQEM